MADKYPAVAPAKKYPVGRPHKAGDPALAKSDIGSTNYGPWPHGQGFSRGVTREEFRADLGGGPRSVYRETPHELDAGQREHRRRLGISRAMKGRR